MYLKPFSELGDLDEWKLILGFGVVNPFGPTLQLLIKEKKDDEKGMHRTALISLHPFSPEIINIWSLREDDNDKRQEVIKTVVNSMEATPTLYLPGTVHSNPNDALPLLIYVASCKGDGKKTLENVKKFVGDPFQRIDSEMADIDIENILKNEDSYEPLNHKEAEYLLRIQLQPENIQAEMDAFDYAYNGAIGFLGVAPELSFDEMDSLRSRLISEA